MSQESDILSFLADSPFTVHHRVDIIAAMSHMGPAHVDGVLSSLAKRGLILKPKTAHYQHKPEAGTPPNDQKPESPSMSWRADGLLPFQRVRLYIEANGPAKKGALCVMLAPFVDQAVRAINAMAVEGMIHARADELMVLGPSPKINPARRAWDPRRGSPPDKPNNPRAERREGDSDKDVRTTAQVELLKANAAEAESPAQDQFPAPATIEQPEEVMTASVTQLHSRPAPSLPEPNDPDSAPAVVEEVTGGIEKVSRAFGGGGGGIMRDGPVVVFSLLTEELEIEISGDDERALTAIRAVLAVLTLLTLKANAQ
jgi:hypothetical protein